MHFLKTYFYLCVLCLYVIYVWVQGGWKQMSDPLELPVTTGCCLMCVL